MCIGRCCGLRDLLSGSPSRSWTTQHKIGGESGSQSDSETCPETGGGSFASFGKSRRKLNRKGVLHESTEVTFAFLNQGLRDEKITFM